MSLIRLAALFLWVERVWRRNFSIQETLICTTDRSRSGLDFFSSEKQDRVRRIHSTKSEETIGLRPFLTQRERSSPDGDNVSVYLFLSSYPREFSEVSICQIH